MKAAKPSNTTYDEHTTAFELIKDIDLSGKKAIVTGASSGIGIETARALAAANAHVTLAVRDTKKGEKIADDIRDSTGNRSVHVAELNLSDIESVNRFVQRWTKPLHILINNAGIMNTPETYTEQGWELQFATNYLGHFALSLGLHDYLKADGAARVVMVSSSGHGNSPVIFDDLFYKNRPYDPGKAYGQSKTAMILFAVEATKRWKQDNITVNALMPGGIWTNLQKDWDPKVLAEMKSRYHGSTPEEGAATSVLLATSTELEGIGGKYYVYCQEAEIVPEIIDGIYGVMNYALEENNAKKLWDVSIKLLE